MLHPAPRPIECSLALSAVDAVLYLPDEYCLQGAFDLMMVS